MKFFKKLRGTPEEMVNQVLKCSWKDKVKNNALDAVCQYAEVLRSPIKKPKFKVFDNEEIYVPTPDMVKTFSALELTKFLSEGFQLSNKDRVGLLPKQTEKCNIKP
jgi:hypothetical protein